VDVVLPQGKRSVGRTSNTIGQWLSSEVLPLFYRRLRWRDPDEAPTLGVSGAAPSQNEHSTVTRSPPTRAIGLKPAPPILSVLQKRAARELFAWVGLDDVPIAYWRILAEMRDPADTLSAFIIQNGLDPLKVRQRDPGELQAFRTICQKEQSSGSVVEPVGDDLLFREVLASLDEVLRLFNGSSATLHIRRFVLLVARVESLRQRPEAVTIKEARAAAQEARGLSAASWRYVLAAARYRGTIAKLNIEWERWAATMFDDAVRRRLIDTAASA